MASSHNPAAAANGRIQGILEALGDEKCYCLTTRGLAGLLHLSVSRTRHLFRAETGVSLGHYLRELRMQRAKQLLETSCLSVKEVMALVGGSDASHFTRDFRKVFGMPPARHREKNRQNTPVAKSANK